MTRRFAFEPEAREVYLELRKDPDGPLYLAVCAVLTDLLADPGRSHVREVRYRPDTWGVRIREGDVRWLLLWRPSADDQDLIEVHYLGFEPGER